MILWLYSKVPARQSWSFCFDEEILRQYHEFDRSLLASQKENCPINIKEVFDIISYGREITPNPVSAQLLFSLGSIVNFEPKMTYTLYKKVPLSFYRCHTKNAMRFREKNHIFRGFFQIILYICQIFIQTVFQSEYAPPSFPVLPA